MRSVMRSIVCAIMAGSAMYLLDMFYRFERKQAVLREQGTSPYADSMQPFQETRLTLITNSAWLDAAMVAALTLFFYYAATRSARKPR